jgi:hypothetical protein
MLDTLASFPTNVFTALLVFCLVFWCVTLVAGGGEEGADGADGAEADGDLDGIGEQIGKVLGGGGVPISLALLLFATGAWAVSSFVSSFVSSVVDVDGAASAVATGATAVAALFGGRLLVRLMRKPAARLLDMEHAPSLDSSMGAIVKIRTTEVTRAFGDAEVLSGPTRGSVIQVRAEAGRFRRGDTALVVDHDAERRSFTIDTVDLPET